MPIKNLFNENFGKTLKNAFKNNLSTYALVLVLVVVMAGLGQVLVRNLQGDKASATIGTTYLSQIGIASVDNISSGAFTDSKKICQTLDGTCQSDGLIDYSFSSLTDRSGVSDASGGGIILDKTSGVFVQNGNLTSKNYIPNANSSVTVTKIQIGVGLKPDTLISMGYSVDGGSNYQTAIGNFTNDQLKAQSNQNLIEYILPTSAKINQGFSYRIALKSNNLSQASPSLKYVRVFYDVTAQNLNIDSSNVVIRPENIGSGTCSPARVVVGGQTTCTWDLINRIGGATYFISQSDIPNNQPITGETTIRRAVIHSQTNTSQISSLNGVRTPSEFNGSEANTPGSGNCSVQNNRLVCDNITANGNLTPGNKHVDLLFMGSTPPNPNINEISGNPVITVNTAPITLTAPVIDIVCLTRVGSASVTGQIGGALNVITGLEATCDADAELTLPGGAKITGRIITAGTFTPNPNQIIPTTTTATGNSNLSSFGNITISTNLTPVADSSGGNFLPVPSGGGDEKLTSK